MVRKRKRGRAGVTSGEGKEDSPVMATPSMREGGEAAEVSISCLQLTQSCAHLACAPPRSLCPGLATVSVRTVRTVRTVLPRCQLLCPACLGRKKARSCPHSSTFSSLEVLCLWWRERAEATEGDRQAGFRPQFLHGGAAK